MNDQKKPTPQKSDAENDTELSELLDSKFHVIF